jgi:hypothetical protein
VIGILSFSTYHPSQKLSSLVTIQAKSKDRYSNQSKVDIKMQVEAA